MFPPGIEPGTFRVLGGCDNHYTTETCYQIPHEHLSIIKHIVSLFFKKHRFTFVELHSQPPPPPPPPPPPYRFSPQSPVTARMQTNVHIDTRNLRSSPDHRIKGSGQKRTLESLQLGKIKGV
ncbi:unnamed protein product [Phyllotreta striolata]|uniref:Uncharacterized protein n=1 Tax=Phyllotreta striolata TaxID=444603 RepID=A0A9N9TWH4_PHYSR|nr:unnamed protein product [Phyllotreta striolata]